MKPTNNKTLGTSVINLIDSKAKSYNLSEKERNHFIKSLAIFRKCNLILLVAKLLYKSLCLSDRPIVRNAKGRFYSDISSAYIVNIFCEYKTYLSISI